MNSSSNDAVSLGAKCSNLAKWDCEGGRGSSIVSLIHRRARRLGTTKVGGCRTEMHCRDFLMRARNCRPETLLLVIVKIRACSTAECVLVAKGMGVIRPSPSASPTVDAQGPPANRAPLRRRQRQRKKNGVAHFLFLAMTAAFVGTEAQNDRPGPFRDYPLLTRLAGDVLSRPLAWLS